MDPLRAEAIKEAAGAVHAVLAAEYGLHTSWYAPRAGAPGPDAEPDTVYFLYTIITLPPYCGEGRATPVPIERLLLADPATIARAIHAESVRELVEHQLAEILARA